MFPNARVFSPLAHSIFVFVGIYLVKRQTRGVAIPGDMSRWCAGLPGGEKSGLGIDNPCAINLDLKMM